MRTTHTVATLDVPAQVYDAIARDLLRADYTHVFENEGAARSFGTGNDLAAEHMGLMDMHGLGLTRGADTRAAEFRQMMVDSAYELIGCDVPLDQIELVLASDRDLLAVVARQIMEITLGLVPGIPAPPAQIVDTHLLQSITPAEIDALIHGDWVLNDDGSAGLAAPADARAGDEQQGHDAAEGQGGDRPAGDVVGDVLAVTTRYDGRLVFISTPGDRPGAGFDVAGENPLPQQLHDAQQLAVSACNPDAKLVSTRPAFYRHARNITVGPGFKPEDFHGVTGLPVYYDGALIGVVQSVALAGEPFTAGPFAAELTLLLSDIGMAGWRDIVKTDGVEFAIGVDSAKFTRKAAPAGDDMAG